MQKHTSNAVEAYQKLEKRLDALIATIDWRAPGASDTKWSAIGQMNTAYDALTQSDRDFIHYKGKNMPSNENYSSNAGAAAVARSRFYRQTIADGVKGRDLIQPLLENGKPNPDFAEHFGDREFSARQKEELR